MKNKSAKNRSMKSKGREEKGVKNEKKRRASFILLASAGLLSVVLGMAGLAAKGLPQSETKSIATPKPKVTLKPKATPKPSAKAKVTPKATVKAKASPKATAKPSGKAFSLTWSDLKAVGMPARGVTAEKFMQERGIKADGTKVRWKNYDYSANAYGDGFWIDMYKPSSQAKTGNAAFVAEPLKAALYRMPMKNEGIINLESAFETDVDYPMRGDYISEMSLMGFRFQNSKQGFIDCVAFYNDASGPKGIKLGMSLEQVKKALAVNLNYFSKFERYEYESDGISYYDFGEGVYGYNSKIDSNGCNMSIYVYQDGETSMIWRHYEGPKKEDSDNRTIFSFRFEDNKLYYMKMNYYYGKN